MAALLRDTESLDSWQSRPREERLAQVRAMLKLLQQQHDRLQTEMEREQLDEVLARQKTQFNQ
eukprot:2014813-Rhodomonas_salina.1